MTDGRDGKATVQHGQAVGYLEVGEGWGREGGLALEWVTLVVEQIRDGQVRMVNNK